MKKAITAMFTGTLVLTAFTTFAQDNTYASATNVNPVAYRTSEDYSPSKELSVSEVNKNALENFSKNNKAVSNVLWTSNGSVLSVYFTKDNVKTRSTYNEKGKWEYTLRYLTAKQTPYKVREAINQYYPGMTILQVTEVKKQGTFYHIVKLEDKTAYLTIQVMNGEVDLFEKVNK